MSFARAPIRRANSSRARSLSVKKSSVVISHGADLRLRPSIPAASTEFNCGDIYAQFRYVMSSGMRNRWRWFSITVLIAALLLWFAQVPDTGAGGRAASLRQAVLVLNVWPQSIRQHFCAIVTRHGKYFMMEYAAMGNQRTICLWSGPRNVSTALMYSFRQRSDTRVVDEPLYGHFLRVSGAEHPAALEVMNHMDCDGDRVMRRLLIAENEERPVQFIKQMAHHLVEIDERFLRVTTNVLLIRDPGEMLPSLVNQIPRPTIRDTGLKRQWELFEVLLLHGEHHPP